MTLRQITVRVGNFFHIKNEILVGILVHTE